MSKITFFYYSKIITSRGKRWGKEAMRLSELHGVIVPLLAISDMQAYPISENVFIHWLCIKFIWKKGLKTK